MAALRPTVAGGSTDRFAGLAGFGVPGFDPDLDAVLGPDVQVAQDHPVLLDVADARGLWGAAERGRGVRSEVRLGGSSEEPCWTGEEQHPTFSLWPSFQ